MNTPTNEPIAVHFVAVGRVDSAKSSVLAADQLPFEPPEAPPGTTLIGLYTETLIVGAFDPTDEIVASLTPADFERHIGDSAYGVVGVDKVAAALAIRDTDFARLMDGEGVAAVTGPIKVLKGQGQLELTREPGEISVAFAGEFSRPDETGYRIGTEWVRWNGPGAGSFEHVLTGGFYTRTTVSSDLTEVVGTLAGQAVLLTDPESSA